MDDSYEAQHRGTGDAYERYLKGMDQSMRQKVALTAAHLLGEGRVADMGMGSGSGTLALASLYPRVQVIGVDVNPEMVVRAQERHVLPNLSFTEGDIATQVFESGSLDGVFDSSVLHHVTSFNGYDHDAAARALSVQAEQLSVGGSLVVRDFVAPTSRMILLDLPDDDAAPGSKNAEGVQSDPRNCSTAALFLRFAGEFRKLADAPGFEFQEQAASPSLRQGWRRFKLDARLAAEFILRKDYRADWESEVLEEYTYFTQERFESEFARLGLRLLASFPIHNPWIVKNRFEGKCALWSTDGARLPFPATNHLIVGEKVPEGEGVAISAVAPAEPTGFLHWHRFGLPDGGVRELVRRPGTTLDVVPWFSVGGALYVLARKSHPRPVMQAVECADTLDGAAPIGYVTEPIVVVQSDAPIGLTVERALKAVADIAPEDVRRLEEVATYYPSPGGIVEEVRAVHVEIPPSYVQGEVENSSGFSSGGRVRAIDAHQLLRAAQVGALPDVRLELNVYELFRRTEQPVGAWIGSEIKILETTGTLKVRQFSDLQAAPRRCFVPLDHAEPRFLELKGAMFAELGADGTRLHAHPREYVVPRELSINTIACALLRRVKGQVLIGLDDDDLAAAQCFTGSSALWVTPAFRLPRAVKEVGAAIDWTRECLAENYGVRASDFVQLGGKYFPSPGVTPEAVHLFAVPVIEESQAVRQLQWFSLDDLTASIDLVRDGHLRIAVNRSAHSLGLLPGS